MTYFHFTVDTDKCIKCQRCIKVCSSACLIQDTNGYPMMKPEADGHCRMAWMLSLPALSSCLSSGRCVYYGPQT